jgi:2-hydroxy-3-keto-5-methylthiopentenyl-1-phosphate phosphatase
MNGLIILLLQRIIEREEIKSINVYKTENNTKKKNEREIDSIYKHDDDNEDDFY